nr:extensin-like [Aegilops tauschii subsp. strangulata]
MPPEQQQQQSRIAPPMASSPARTSLPVLLHLASSSDDRRRRRRPREKLRCPSPPPVVSSPPSSYLRVSLSLFKQERCRLSLPPPHLAGSATPTTDLLRSGQSSVNPPQASRHHPPEPDSAGSLPPDLLGSGNQVMPPLPVPHLFSLLLLSELTPPWPPVCRSPMHPTG